MNSREQFGLSIDSPQFARNYGFWGEDEQNAILNEKIAIAGVGGDGFQLGLKLAQIGIQRFSIADPEVFEPENTNRVPGAVRSAYGKNKAEVFKQCVIDINPHAEVTVFTEGVQEHNVTRFMQDATLVLDESELTRPYIGTLVAREARRIGIPNIFVENIGFAGVATSFHPHKGKTFEWMMGLNESMSIDEIRWLSRDEGDRGGVERVPRPARLDRCIPYLPTRYGDIRSLNEVINGAPLPSIATGVDMAAAIGESEVLKHIFAGVDSRWPKPVWAPHFRYMDAMTGESGIVKYPLAAYRKRVVRMLLRNQLRLNPFASYSEPERRRRIDSYRSRLPSDL